MAIRARSCLIRKWKEHILASSLTIENVSAGYGAVHVLSDVTLAAGDGETVVLLGTNGNGQKHGDQMRDRSGAANRWPHSC